MSDTLVISKQEDIFPAIIAKRIDSSDATWISLMLFLGKKWTIRGDKFENRKNVLLSMREYWKGTYEQ